MEESQPAGRQGFTLLEVLVSATIIVVLTSIGLVSYSSVNKKSRDVKRRGDLEQIRSALEIYRSDNGAYPSAGSGSMTNAQNLASTLVSTYAPAIPDDPSGTGDYYYQAIVTGGIYSSYCICANLEAITTGSQSTCTVTLPAQCDYGVKSP